MSYLHVATQRTGDIETTIRVVSDSQDPNTVFGDWWGEENTYKRSAIGGKRWEPDGGMTSIKHNSTEELTETEAEVLSKYLTVK